MLSQEFLPLIILLARVLPFMTLSRAAHRQGRDISPVCVLMCMHVRVCSYMTVNSHTTPYDVHSAVLIFDPLPKPCMSGVKTVTAPTAPSQDPTEPHPQTTNPSMNDAPTFSQSGIVIHLKKSVSVTPSDSSDV